MSAPDHSVWHANVLANVADIPGFGYSSGKDVDVSALLSAIIYFCLFLLDNFEF